MRDEYATHFWNVMHLVLPVGECAIADVFARALPFIDDPGRMSLTHNGIEVELLLDSSEDEPYLDDGSTIAPENTETPVPAEEVLAGVDRLVKTVPLKNLTTVVRELGDALNGKGDDLQVLVDTLGSLPETANDTLPETLSLIRDSRTVLDTQSEQPSAIGRFSTDLDSVAGQLRSNDPDIRRIIETGTAASDQVYAVITEGGPALTTNLANINSVTEPTGLKALALRPLLIFLPALAAGAGSIVPNDCTAHLGLVLETNNPPPCTIGYEGSQAILDEEKANDPNFDITEESYPLNLQGNCATPQGSVTGVRSANRIVLADPETPQPWDSKPKVDPEKLDLNPIASQLAPLVGATPK